MMIHEHDTPNGPRSLKLYSVAFFTWNESFSNLDRHDVLAVGYEMKDAIQRVKEAAERDARDFTATEITDVVGFKISAVEGLEEKSVETSINGVNSPSLYSYIQHIDLESEADIQKLNTLDARIRDMTQEEQSL